MNRQLYAVIIAMPKDVWHTFYVCENGWLSEENILQGIKDVHPKMLYYIKAFYK